MTARTDEPACRWCHGALARIRGGVTVCPTCDVPPKSVATVAAHQVALCLLQLKVSRLCVTPTHADSWADAIGYLALGAEVAGREEEST